MFYKSTGCVGCEIIRITFAWVWQLITQICIKLMCMIYVSLWCVH